MAFILEKTKSSFKETIYHGIYRDDGIVFFENKWSNREIQEWLESFQRRVNRVCGSTDITLSYEIGQCYLTERKTKLEAYLRYHQQILDI